MQPINKWCKTDLLLFMWTDLFIKSHSGCTCGKWDFRETSAVIIFALEVIQFLFQVFCSYFSVTY